MYYSIIEHMEQDKSHESDIELKQQKSRRTVLQVIGGTTLLGLGVGGSAMPILAEEEKPVTLLDADLDVLQQTINLSKQGPLPVKITTYNPAGGVNPDFITGGNEVVEGVNPCFLPESIAQLRFSENPISRINQLIDAEIGTRVTGLQETGNGSVVGRVPLQDLPLDTGDDELTAFWYAETEENIYYFVAHDEITVRSKPNQGE
jgi:hypothetical protein